MSSQNQIAVFYSDSQRANPTFTFHRERTTNGPLDGSGLPNEGFVTYVTGPTVQGAMDLATFWGGYQQTYHPNITSPVFSSVPPDAIEQALTDRELCTDAYGSTDPMSVLDFEEVIQRLYDQPSPRAPIQEDEGIDVEYDSDEQMGEGGGLVHHAEAMPEHVGRGTQSRADPLDDAFLNKFQTSLNLV